MTIQNTRKNKIIISLFCLIAAILCAMQCVVMYNCYDTEVNLYTRGAVLPTVTNILMFAYCVIVFVYGIILGKNKDLPQRNPMVYGPTKTFSIICAFLFAVSGVYNCITRFSNYYARSEIGIIAHTRSETLLLISSVISLVAFVFFVLVAFLKDKNQLKAVFGMVVIVWAAVALLGVYFDNDTHINDPIKVFICFSLITGMLYMLMEIRFLLKQPKSGLFVAFSLMAFTLNASTGLSLVICELTKKIDVEANLFMLIFLFAFSLYVMSRLSSFIYYKKTEEASKEDTEAVEEKSEE